MKVKRKNTKMNLNKIVGELRSPDTGLSLKISTEEENPTDWTPVNTTGKNKKSLDFDQVYISSVDGQESFPIVDGFPVLLAPEKRIAAGSGVVVPVYDLEDDKYAEAYEEMEVYNAMCEELVEKALAGDDGPLMDCMGGLSTHGDQRKIDFPNPPSVWLDARHDSISQYEAYDYLAPMDNVVFMQMGGQGSHAVKALLAGASDAYLLTPMIGEAKLAMYLAERFNVDERLHCIIGIGEELPFRDQLFDRIYSGGCFHHMRLEFASIQLKRVLKTGGRFSGVDPWKTPLHTIGTCIIGKREKSVFCKPITPERLAPVEKTFTDIKTTRHGPILRYLFLALEKLGVKYSIPTMLKIGKIDDAIGKNLRINNYGGSLMIAGTKSAE